MYLICGEALFDLFLNKDDGLGALDFEARAGGSPFNVAVGIARQGGRSGLFTGISDDMLGDRLAAMLEREGVDTRFLVRSGRRTTLSLVDLTQSGAPSYSFYGVGSADCSLDVNDLPDLDDTIKGLHFGSYSIAVEPVATAFAALARREQHRFISLDPNVRPTIVSDPTIWRDRIADLLPFVDLVKVSEEDIEMLFPDASSETIARNWLKAGPSIVVVTDGAKSVRAYRPDVALHAIPPSVDVVDTVGAGDAFQAALLACLMRSESSVLSPTTVSDMTLQAAIEEAARVAAATCQRRGADIPSVALSL